MNTIKAARNLASIILTSLLILSSCSMSENHEAAKEKIATQDDLSKTVSNETTPTATVCVDPRPQICTREYRPVCAKLQDDSYKTFATGCTACSNAKVVEYVPGTCAN